MCANAISESDGRWIVYILQCADMTLYTGITTDLQARLVKHANGTGAKYTRGRGPYEVVFVEKCATKSDALKHEAEIKSLSKVQKLRLINAHDKVRILF